MALIHRLLALPGIDMAQKVRWRMRYDRNPRFIALQDKLRVRDYARRRNVAMAKLLQVCDHPEALQLDLLPPDCFIKANHGWNWNILRLDSRFYLFESGADCIHPETGRFDIDLARSLELDHAGVIRTCRDWLNRRHGREDEWAYHGIEPRLLAEELLTGTDGGPLVDYRLYTFAGEVKAISVGSAAYRRAGVNLFLDPDWNLIELTRYRESLPQTLPPRPRRLAQMSDAAARLGDGLDFVRVDLYDTGQGIRLGEMTLYPEAGQRNTPTACPRFNRWLGDQWLPLDPASGSGG